LAYLSGSATGYTDGAATSLSVPLPAHKSGDLLLALVTQDGGTGTITISGWTAIGTHAASAGVKSGWFGKIAASSSETDPTASSTISDEMVMTLYVVPDADTSSTVANAIHASARNDTTSGTQSSPSLTTTIDNCLILYSWSFDGAASFCVTSPDKIIITDSDETTSTCTHMAGYFQQHAAGAVPSQNADNNINDGGNAWAIAVKNATGGGRGQAMTQCAEVLALLSGAGTDTNLTTASLSAIAATIGGKTVNTTGLGTTPGESGHNYSRNGYFETYTSSASVTDDWMGVAFTLASSANLSGKLVSILWGNFSSASLYGAEGFVVVFSDGTNWAAFRLLTAAQLAAGVIYNTILKVDSATPLDSSGSINWGAVTKVGVAYHRTTATGTSGKTFNVKRIMAVSAATFVGGSSAAPVTAGVIGAPFNGCGLNYVIDLQGERQVLTRVPLQIGDGSLATYYRARGSSIEIPGDYLAAGAQRFWNVPPLGLKIVVRASASDTMDFSSGTIRSGSKQTFEIHASSSTSAAYNFDGATFVGLAVTWQSGVTCNGANFAGCYQITANGGTFTGCAISGCLDTVALKTAAPNLISGCSFTQGNAGHAIEITTPGTYSFSGNTFSGYGSAGSTDAAIYNNSGGAVTLNITGGGSTPTVRNGAGASTTVNSGATLTLTGLQTGSDIVILDAGTTTERVNVDAHGATSYGFSYTATGNVDICVFKAGYVPFFVRGFTLTTSDATLPIAQVADRNYSNP